MGEIADMMLEGDLCAGCGGFIDSEGGDGFPRYCSRQCARDHGVVAEPNRRHPSPITRPRNGKVACPTCGRRVKEVGLNDHQRDAHVSAAGKSGVSR